MFRVFEHDRRKFELGITKTFQMSVCLSSFLLKRKWFCIMFNNMLGNDVLRLLTQSNSQFMHNWEKATRPQLSCFCCSSSCSRRERHRVRCSIMTCICHLVLVLYLMLIRSLHDFHSRSARPVPHQNFVPDLRESLAPICKAQQLCKNAKSVM